ncbi:MAG: NUDIX domain-containing protein [Sphaerochaetaceae bacterium]|nr:NUDIX domain-containing protein [Sphaerochaetaceae bacterium]
MAFINENEKYCTTCGSLYEVRDMEGEGKVQFCPTCNAWHFPVFNTACIMIVVDRVNRKILLIKQYGRPDYILVAGYVNRGEDAETTVAREVKEETGLDVVQIHFNRSEYFERSNSLMLNFTAYVDDASSMKVNREVDSYAWFSFEDARKNIKEGSLAKKFLEAYLDEAPFPDDICQTLL